MSDNALLADHIREAIAAHQQGFLDAAEAGYRRVLALAPDHFDARHLLGVIALQRGDFNAAVDLITAAIASGPNNATTADAYNNLAIALTKLGRPVEALTAYRHVIAVKPDHVTAHFNSGNLHQQTGDKDAALASYDAGLRIKPDDPEILHNRGMLLLEMKRGDEALAALDRALQLKPDLPFLDGLVLYLKARNCDWRGYDADIARLKEKIERGAGASQPFYLLWVLDSPRLQLACARTWMNAKYPAHARSLAAMPPAGPKLRIGYFSMDFRDHLVGRIAADVFERQDHERFEIYAFSYGPNTHPEMRARLTKAVHDFIDVRDKSDAEIAQLSRDMKIDVAVDLACHSTDSRPGIFAARAAAVQVSWQVCWTSGSNAMDYIVADRTVIPESARSFYSEKIIDMPGSFLAVMTPPVLPGLKDTPARAALGLPEDGFVFCSFNALQKITPRIFDSWMRILKRVEGSVLWLAHGKAAAITNLHREAEDRGISAARLIFAPRLPDAKHLARQRAAGLFLDTWPYNGHTTTRDALSAGLPVLTLAGASFPARVSASLLTVLEMPELITTRREDYEDIAAALAADSQRLEGLKQKLARQLSTKRLFDGSLYVRELEEAFTRVAARARAGLPPDHLVL